MRQKQGVFSLFLLSPSSRRAWIEILVTLGAVRAAAKSPSSRRAWIEIDGNEKTTAMGKVALLAEGVDRNLQNNRAQAVRTGRPPRGGRG